MKYVPLWLWVIKDSVVLLRLLHCAILADTCLRQRDPSLTNFNHCCLSSLQFTTDCSLNSSFGTSRTGVSLTNKYVRCFWPPVWLIPTLWASGVEITECCRLCRDDVGEASDLPCARALNSESLLHAAGARNQKERKEGRTGSGDWSPGDCNTCRGRGWGAIRLGQAEADMLSCNAWMSCY